MSETTARMITDAVGNLVDQSYDAASDTYKADKSTGQAKHVTQKDANDNTIGGAFAPADSGQADLTGTAAQQIQALPTGCSYLRFDVITAAANIKFGTSASLAATPVTTTSGTRLRAGATEVFAVPTGTTHFGYIGNTAAINWTPA